MKVRHDMRKAIDETDANGFRTLPLVSASAAKTKDGAVVVSLSNVSLDKAQVVEVSLPTSAAANIQGDLLTSADVRDFNDFEHPAVVSPADFKQARLKKDILSVKMPAKSIVVLTIK
jgi:alpha-N-arabinofuranosidase